MFTAVNRSEDVAVCSHLILLDHVICTVCFVIRFIIFWPVCVCWYYRIRCVLIVMAVAQVNVQFVLLMTKKAHLYFPVIRWVL